MNINCIKVFGKFAILVFNKIAYQLVIFYANCYEIEINSIEK